MANKQKAWCTAAVAAKRAAIADGTHITGKRYGRLHKDTYVKVLPFPSTLFQQLCNWAGLDTYWWADKLKRGIHDELIHTGTNTGRITSGTPSFAEVPRQGGRLTRWLGRFNALFGR